MRLDDKDFDDLEIEDIETVRKRVERKKRAGKRKKKGIPPLVLSVIVISVVLLLIISVFLGKGTLGEMGAIEVTADISDLFGGFNDGEAGIILNDGYVTDVKAFKEGKKLFLPYDFVLSEINDWFYYDEKEGLVLYTTPDGTDRIETGKEAKEINGVFCLSSDLVLKYTDIEYRDFLSGDDPYVYIRNAWGKHSEAETVKKTAVYQYSEDKKNVLAALDKGEAIRIIDAGNETTRVQTQKGLIGFVENKNIDDYKDKEDKAPGRVRDMDFPSTGFNQKVILGWHQVMNHDANQGVYDLLLKDSAINVLSPTWYSLKDKEGAITDISSAEYVKAAHEAGKQVWPVIDNFNCPDFMVESGSNEVLSDTASREKITAALIESVKESGADGINVDFEGLPGESGPGFAQFIKELSVAAHDAGLLISVDNYVPEAHSQHYHREVQGKVCDYVIIMGYDEHNAVSTEAGPVASLDFVEQGIERTLLEVDAHKVINGIPFYSRLWGTKGGVVDSTRATGMGESEEILSSHNVTPTWDDGAGCNYGEYESEGVLWRIWLEDEDSINAKLSIMDGYDLAGAAFWKLGLEDDKIWDDIAAYASDNTGKAPDKDNGKAEE